MKVIKPTWVKAGTGSSISVGREGTVLLEFANSQGEKNYDWENKGVSGGLVGIYAAWGCKARPVLPGTSTTSQCLDADNGAARAPPMRVAVR